MYEASGQHQLTTGMGTVLPTASSLFNGMEGIEIGSGSSSEIQAYIGSNSTAFGGDSEVKASRYGRVLRKKTK